MCSSSSTLAQPEDLDPVQPLPLQGPRQRPVARPDCVPHHLLGLIVSPSQPTLSHIDATGLSVLGTLPVVGLDVILHPPALELRGLGAGQAAVLDPRVVLEPVDQVVDVVVADPWIVPQRELPQKVEVLQDAVLEVVEAVVGQVELTEVQLARESRCREKTSFCF